MGSKTLELFWVLSNCLYFLASSSPLHRALLSSASDTLQEHNLEAIGRNDHDIKGIDGDGRGIVHLSKYARGGGGVRGTHNGGSYGKPKNGNGGGNTKGGAAVIPIIVAGAANHNTHQNSHHNGANCKRSRIELPIVILATFVSLISLISRST